MVKSEKEKKRKETCGYFGEEKFAPYVAGVRWRLLAGVAGTFFFK